MDSGGQGALATAHEDRPEKEIALVDQPLADRPAAELRPADRDVGSRATTHQLPETRYEHHPTAHIAFQERKPCAPRMPSELWSCYAIPKRGGLRVLMGDLLGV